MVDMINIFTLLPVSRLVMVSFDTPRQLEGASSLTVTPRSAGDTVATRVAVDGPSFFVMVMLVDGNMIAIIPDIRYLFLFWQELGLMMVFRDAEIMTQHNLS